jgi:hypothetical protein
MSVVFPSGLEWESPRWAYAAVSRHTEGLVRSYSHFVEPRYTPFGQCTGAYAETICKAIARVPHSHESFQFFVVSNMLLYAIFDDLAQILKTTSSYSVPILVTLAVSSLLRAFVFTLTTPTKEISLARHVSVDLWSWLIPQFDWLQNGFKHIHDAFDRVRHTTTFGSIYLTHV